MHGGNSTAPGTAFPNEMNDCHCQKNAGHGCRGERRGGECNEKTEDQGQDAGEHQYPHENSSFWHYRELDKVYNHVSMKGRERRSLKENKRWS